MRSAVPPGEEGRVRRACLSPAPDLQAGWRPAGLSWLTTQNEAAERVSAPWESLLGRRSSLLCCRGQNGAGPPGHQAGGRDVTQNREGSRRGSGSGRWAAREGTSSASRCPSFTARGEKGTFVCGNLDSAAHSILHAEAEAVAQGLGSQPLPCHPKVLGINISPLTYWVDNSEAN